MNNIVVLVEEYNELVAEHDRIMDSFFFDPEPSYGMTKEMNTALKAIKQRMDEIEDLVKSYNESNK